MQKRTEYNLIVRFGKSEAEVTNKCVSKAHIWRTWGAVKTMCNTPCPLFKGNIAITDCMPLSNILRTIKINGGVQCRQCIKIAIVDKYLVHHCWK